MPLSPLKQATHDRNVAACAQLDEATFAAGEEGRAMTLELAIAEALGGGG